jgi:flagellar capping protein FliD
LSYKSTVTGVDASLNIDGVDLTSASNTATNLIPGVTFQILSPTTTDSNGDPVPVQVIIANDNSGVESAVNTMVTDYNSLINAINAQTGNDSSGKCRAAVWFADIVAVAAAIAKPHQYAESQRVSGRDQERERHTFRDDLDPGRQRNGSPD